MASVIRFFAPFFGQNMVEFGLFQKLEFHVVARFRVYLQPIFGLSLESLELLVLNLILHVLDEAADDLLVHGLVLDGHLDAHGLTLHRAVPLNALHIVLEEQLRLVRLDIGRPNYVSSACTPQMLHHLELVDFSRGSVGVQRRHRL